MPCRLSLANWIFILSNSTFCQSRLFVDLDFDAGVDGTWCAGHGGTAESQVRRAECSWTGVRRQLAEGQRRTSADVAGSEQSASRAGSEERGDTTTTTASVWARDKGNGTELDGRLLFCLSAIRSAAADRHVASHNFLWGQGNLGIKKRLSQAMVTTCAIVPLTDSWQERLPTLTTDHFSPECYSLRDSYWPFYFTWLFLLFLLMCIVAICQGLFKGICGYMDGSLYWSINSKCEIYSKKIVALI